MQVDNPETKEPACNTTSDKQHQSRQMRQEAAEGRGQDRTWAAKGNPSTAPASAGLSASSCAPAQGPEATSQGSLPWATGANTTARIRSVN